MRHALLVLVCLSLPALAGAQPSISSVSGTLSHGSSITITGTGFGTKGTAAPLAYDDWQSVTLGADVDTSTAVAWNTDGGARQPVASNARLRSGTPFTRNMRCEWQTSDTLSGCSANLIAQNFTKLYLDAWLYHDTNGEPNTTTLNIKPWRLHETGWGEPNWFMNFYETDDTDGQALNADAIAGWTCAWFGSSPCDGTRPGLTDAYNTWHHMQYVLHFGTAATADGDAWLYWDGPLVASWTDKLMMNSGHGDDYDDLAIGNYVRADDPTVTHYAYWESVYVDVETLRAEITNNATYASATHREILIPTAWSATSITAEFNRGSFAVNDSIYVCVTNASEQHDCDGPYTVGGAGGGGRSRVHVIGLLAVCLAGWVRWR